MIKTLTKHGTSLALILDRSILKLLKIDAKTPLEIIVDGRTLIISSIISQQEQVASTYKAVNKRYRTTLKRLAR